MPKKSPISKYADVATGVRLSSHEKLCAERMNNILKSIEEMKKEVKDLRQDVSKGKGAISVLVFLGTIILSCIGFFQFK
ncbi:prefoldin subunit [Pelagibacter phage Jormungand EXVC012P]|nr:prefoldin subunit [Pelagibacter phage Jormungand EXVC012P]QLF88556.1 prefoldin subunit [Pelagibacter phage Ran EXVC014P]